MSIEQNLKVSVTEQQIVKCEKKSTGSSKNKGYENLREDPIVKNGNIMGPRKDFSKNGTIMGPFQGDLKNWDLENGTA